MNRKFLLQLPGIFCRYRRISSMHFLRKNSIFTSIEPNGPMHIGNYYGAFKDCVSMQNCGHDVVCSISDMLSLTLPQTSRLQEHVFLTTACLIGCGLKPEKSIIFLQSLIPQHSQLCWVFGCLTDLTELPKIKKDVPLGLYLRPLSQTTDILLYKCSDLCIGYEKSLHLPLAKSIAQKFNNIYGETFYVPNSVRLASFTIKNLRNPTEKMSKSGTFDRSRINLTDSPDVMLWKIKKAVTDLTSSVSFDLEKRPGVSNLVVIHSAVTGKTYDELCSEAANLDTGMYKMRVAEALIETMKPIHFKINDLLTDKSYLASILKEGAEKALNIADQTWKPVREKIGSHVG